MYISRSAIKQKREEGGINYIKYFLFAEFYSLLENILTQEAK